MKTNYEVGDMAIIIRCDTFKHDHSQKYIDKVVGITKKGDRKTPPYVTLYDQWVENDGRIIDNFTCDIRELCAIEDYIEIIDSNLDKLISKYETR